MYKISWKPKALRQFEKVRDKATRHQIFDAIDGLISFPQCRNIKTLKNHQCEYRLRVGRYRVLFDVNEIIKIIDIVEVKKRDERTY